VFIAYCVVCCGVGVIWQKYFGMYNWMRYDVVLCYVMSCGVNLCGVVCDLM
jgi:hypothetical protein